LLDGVQIPLSNQATSCCIVFILIFFFVLRKKPYMPAKFAIAAIQRTAKGNLSDEGIHNTTHNRGSCFAMTSDLYVT